MKWNKQAFVQKVLPVIGYICGVAFLVLSAFELCDIQIVPKAVGYALFGVFYLTQGPIQESRKRKIWTYILAALWFLLAVMWCF